MEREGPKREDRGAGRGEELRKWFILRSKKPPLKRKIDQFVNFGGFCPTSAYREFVMRVRSHGIFFVRQNSP